MKQEFRASALLCEEIRREASGTAVIVGARQDGFSLDFSRSDRVPRLAIYIELELFSRPPEVVSVRFSSQDDSDIVFENEFSLDSSVTGEIPKDAAEVKGSLVIAINQENMKIVSAGIYCIKLKLDEQDWSTLREYAFIESSDDDSE